MGKNRDSKDHKRKDDKKTEAYRLLEKICHEANEGKYKSKHLSNLLLGYKGKLPYKFVETQLRKSQPYARIAELKYNQTSKASSQAGGKYWTEPTVYKPPERLVYDPDVKRLLEKIEAHLRNGLDIENKQSIESLDVDELLSKLQKNYDSDAYERLLEKLLKEINKAEPKPDLEVAEQKDKEKQYSKETEKTETSETDVELEDIIMKANEAAIPEHSDEILERMLGGEETGERMREGFMAEKETKTEEQPETSESESENVEVEEVEENCENTEKAEADEEPTEPQTGMEVEDESEFSSDEIPAEPLQEVETPVEEEAIDTEPSCD